MAPRRVRHRARSDHARCAPRDRTRARPTDPFHNREHARLYDTAVARRQADQIYNLSLTRTATVTLGHGARAVSEDIARLLERIARCPPDSKLHTPIETLRALNDRGYAQVMVFTQFTDTMDFLREALRSEALWRLLCFSGRGGEVPTTEGGWRRVERDEIKRRFRDAEADILLCTDAAAEGLNFQFCGALVNYDMPWNPMRVQQRIGRIDRLGQRHAHQALHRPLVVALARSSVPVADQIVRQKAAE